MSSSEGDLAIGVIDEIVVVFLRNSSDAVDTGVDILALVQPVEEGVVVDVDIEDLLLFGSVGDALTKLHGPHLVECGFGRGDGSGADGLGGVSVADLAVGREVGQLDILATGGAELVGELGVNSERRVGCCRDGKFCGGGGGGDGGGSGRVGQGGRSRQRWWDRDGHPLI